MGITSRMLRVDGASAVHTGSHRVPSDRPVSSSAGGVFRGSKRLCAERAQWRLVRGQDAKRLSEHYRLECDYGTSTLTVYSEGDPVFLCATHLSAITPGDNCIAGVRPLEAKDESSDRKIASVEQETAQRTLIAAALAGSTGPPGTTDVPATAGMDAPSGPTAIDVTQGGDRSPRANTGAMATATEMAKAPPPFVVAPHEVASSLPNEAAATAPLADAAQSGQPDVVRPDLPLVESVAAIRRVVSVTPKRETAPVSRTPARDLTYGNPTKALVDETIWNMAAGDLNAYRSGLERGKTEMEAAQAAGGQIAVIHRKIAEYTAKIEPMLSASKASISTGYAIDKPLEQAILEVIGSSAMSEAEKDRAVAQLGALQEQIKSGLQRDIAPIQAHQITQKIGQGCNWGGDSELRDEVKHAYRAVYTRLRDALRAFVPEARELDERLANLYAAKADLESAPGAKAVRSAAL